MKSESDNPGFKFNSTKKIMPSIEKPKSKIISLASKRISLKPKSKIISLASKRISLTPKRQQEKASKRSSLNSKRQQHGRRKFSLTSKRNQEEEEDSDIGEDNGNEDDDIAARMRSIVAEQRKLELVQKELLDLDEQLGQYKPQTSSKKKKRAALRKPKSKRRAVLTKRKKAKKFVRQGRRHQDNDSGSKFTVTFNQD